MGVESKTSVVSASAMVAVAAIVACLPGCKGATAPQIGVDASAAASRAIECYDKDLDGALTIAECEASRGLSRVFNSYDTDSDGLLTENELEQGIVEWTAYPYPIPVEVQVTCNRQYLSGATVKLIPDQFLADVLPAGDGVTDNEGIAKLHASAYQFPPNLKDQRRMFAGLYSVEVTPPPGDVPSNQTGVAVTKAAISYRTVKLDLTRRGRESTVAIKESN